MDPPWCRCSGLGLEWSLLLPGAEGARAAQTGVDKGLSLETAWGSQERGRVGVCEWKGVGVPEPWEVGVWVQAEKLGLSPRELPKGLEAGRRAEPEQAWGEQGRAWPGASLCPRDSFLASFRVLSPES